jgi:hypothetical protein
VTSAWEASTLPPSTVVPAGEDGGVGEQAGDGMAGAATRSGRLRRSILGAYNDGRRQPTGLGLAEGIDHRW